MCLGVLVVSFAVIAVTARLGGLLVYAPKSGGHLRRFFTAMVVPAIGEEAVFRVMLWPSAGADQWIWIGLSIAVFVLWHVFEGTTFLKAHRSVLLNPYFLVCAAILGAACSVMVFITGSIWPAIITHALLVYVWQSFFGGLSLFEKRAD